MPAIHMKKIYEKCSHTDIWEDPASEDAGGMKKKMLIISCMIVVYPSFVTL